MIRPLKKNVIVKPPVIEKQTASGIVLPDSTTEKRVQEGEVLAYGSECQDIKEGDTVLFSEYAPIEIKLQDVKYYVVDEKDILAIINETDTP